MSKRRGLIILVTCSFAAILALGLYAWWNLGASIAGIHQRSTTRELRNWEQEYGRVGDWQEADHAIDMLEYVQHYYGPGPGYRSDLQTEADLESQRARTLAAIAVGLQRFCGEDLGTDVSRWRAWREQHGPPPREGK
jgi:hypothetical protein